MTDLVLGKSAPGARTRQRERRWLRIALIGAGPLALAVAGSYLYLTSGRFVSTDDAYIRADITQISTEVAGKISEVDVHENEQVKAGQLLFRLDAAPYRYAAERAEAELATARLEIEALRATYAQKQAELKAAQDTLDYQNREFDRQKMLQASHVASQQLYDQARHNVDAARQAVDGVRQAMANALANLGGDAKIPTDSHPRVMAAQAQLEQAKLDLARTHVHAPADGTVAKVDMLQKGMHVTIGQPLFSLIGDNAWVEANFKETDLTHMRPGQTATIDVDTYPDHAFTGTVCGISPGAGSEFSVLPAQNATGNWVKIVQRVSVRVCIAGNDPAMPLRSGMSVVVDVDTKYRHPWAAMIASAFAGVTGGRQP